MAIKVRLKLRDISKRTRRDDLLERNEVRIPSSVLVNSELLARLLRNVAELICFLSSRNERLLNDDVLARLQSGFAHVEVSLRDAGDDKDVYGGILQGFVDATVGFGAGVVFLCVVVGFGRALDDAVELVDVWESPDERDVEDFGALEVLALNGRKTTRYC